jgi:transposase
MTRMKCQLARDRVRLHNQVECLLEEMRIKLSSVLSDLLGVSGLRILRALAAGESDPQRLAALGDERLQCGQQRLMDALTGKPEPMHQQLLELYLQRLQLVDEQSQQLNGMIAQAMQAHQDAVVRLAEVPGFGADSAQPVIAEVGAAGQYVCLGGAADLVGGNLPRAERKRRAELQQSLGQRQ